MTNKYMGKKSKFNNESNNIFFNIFNFTKSDDNIQKINITNVDDKSIINNINGNNSEENLIKYQNEMLKEKQNNNNNIYKDKNNELYDKFKDKHKDT